MKHYGDITKINGAMVEPVNVIIGGSPCQDLSVAGKRAGLAGERSGLFMEQLRIIKEMRFADEFIRGRKGTDIRPRFMVWENVPGAFSSNKGEDFGAVLQETFRVVCEETPAIPYPKNGWPTAGCLVGVGGNQVLLGEYLTHSFGESPNVDVESHLSQILEAQPQEKYYLSAKACQGILRRAERRGKKLPPMLKQALYEMIAYWDRGGRTYDVRISSNGTKNWRAHCYETDISRSLDTAEPNPDSNHGGVAVVAAMATQQVAAENNQPVICIQGNCIDRADTAGCNGKGWTENVSYTLNTIDRPAVAMAVENHPNDSRVKLSDDGIVQTLSGRMGTGGGNTPMVLECYSQGGYGAYVEGKAAGTLRNAGGITEVARKH